MERATASCSSSQQYNNGEIGQLIEVFGSAFSIEYICSTYLQANHNLDVACGILCDLQAAGTASAVPPQPKDVKGKSLSMSTESFDLNGSVLHPCDLQAAGTASAVPPQPKDVKGKSLSMSTESFNLNGSVLHPCAAQGNSEAPNLTEGPVALGSNLTIAQVPTKLLPSPSPGRVTTKTTGEDVDEFLFNMLGDGFQLDMGVIHEVLRTCGYDMEKSIETLLDTSACPLGKGDPTLSKATEDDIGSGVLLRKRDSEDYDEEMMRLTCQKKPQHGTSSRSSKKKNKDKTGLEKELLQSLFTASVRLEEEPKKIHPHKEANRSRRYGMISEPLEETPIELKTLYVTPPQTSKDEEESEENFRVLRQAVAEHWATMKEYYKAAGEAYLKGDLVRANKLMEEGHFFGRKAREVDEMSVQTIVGTGEEEEEELLLDLTVLEPRESVQHLKTQLLHLSGIASIPYLKIRLGNGGGTKEDSRKRLVLKLLDKESIKWTEMESGQTLLIKLEEINPQTLSFSKRK